mmetsp:Transcript_57220/g.179685  ORF Transcript_57220/g.179685 Transcript_57220/m.179685 type:complete len:250 (-) Transcript_57220:9-758(-)
MPRHTCRGGTALGCTFALLRQTVRRTGCCNTLVAGLLSLFQLLRRVDLVRGAVRCDGINDLSVVTACAAPHKLHEALGRITEVLVAPWSGGAPVDSDGGEALDAVPPALRKVAALAPVLAEAFLLLPDDALVFASSGARRPLPLCVLPDGLELAAVRAALRKVLYNVHLGVPRHGSVGRPTRAPQRLLGLPWLRGSGLFPGILSIVRRNATCRGGSYGVPHVEGTGLDLEGRLWVLAEAAPDKVHKAGG